MKAILLALSLVLFSAGVAEAQEMWLVGSSESLDAQWTATAKSFCNDSTYCREVIGVENFDRNNFGDPSWGLGEIDCKPVTEFEMYWADLEFEGQPTYQTASVVSNFENLPQICQDEWLVLLCGPANSPQRAVTCDMGVMECCE